ncbi:MAG: GTPase ObgE, partial [Pseudomonadota bacterium]
LADKPEILALSKCDAVDKATQDARAAEIEALTGKAPLRLSSASGEGVREALFALTRVIDAARAAEDDAAGAAEGAAKTPWQPAL